MIDERCWRLSSILDPRFVVFVLAWLHAMWRACWQGAVAIALVWLVCRALPRMPASIRCWLWRLAYLKLIVALLWTSPIHLALLPAPPVRPVVREQVAPSAPAVAAPSPPAKPAPAGTVPRPRSPYGACALLILWLIGVGWRVMDIAYEWRTVRRQRRTGIADAVGEASAPYLAQLSRQFRLRRVPPLIVSDEVTGPLLTGLWRPTIIIPGSLFRVGGESLPRRPSSPDGWESREKDSPPTSPDELRLIIAHELAHCKRRDLLWGWLPALAQALFFFHPLVRMATREWKLVHESACDELTLLTTEASVADYGSVLLKVATNNRSPRYSQLVAVGVVESHQSLKRRFVMMERAGQVTKRNLLLTGALVMLLGVMAIVPWRVIAQAGGGTWTSKAPIPVPGQGKGAAGVSGNLYVLGGRPGGCNDSSSLLAYDPPTNTWMTKSPMLTARSQFGVGVVNGILYAIGGTIGCGSPSDAVEAYDPVTNKWTTKAPMPIVQEDSGMGVVNGIIYAVGGHNGISLLATVQAYDPVTETWTTKASLPTPRSFLAVGVVDGILYAVGGSDGRQLLATVEAFDPRQNAWTTKATMPTPRNQLAVGVIDGILYAVGGQGSSGGLATNEAYDPVTNTWTTEASMPTERLVLAIGVVNGVLYAVGGGNAASGPLVAANEAFTPAGSLNIAPIAVAKAPAQVISSNKTSAAVTLDGSRSSDPDHDPLTYAWFVDGSFASSAVTTTLSMTVGNHSVRLEVSDGRATSSATITVSVITAAQAVGKCIALVSAANIPKEKQELLNALRDAAKQFNRGHFGEGVQELMEFQKKVAELLRKGRVSPATATSLNKCAQQIIDAIGGVRRDNDDNNRDDGNRDQRNGSSKR